MAVELFFFEAGDIMDFELEDSMVKVEFVKPFALRTIYNCHFYTSTNELERASKSFKQVDRADARMYITVCEDVPLVEMLRLDK